MDGLSGRIEWAGWNWEGWTEMNEWAGACANPQVAGPRDGEW